MRLYLSIIFFLTCSSISFSQLLFDDEAVIRGLTGITSYDGNGNGLSFADYNNDGLDDVTLPTGNDETLKFYKNVNGVFVEDRVLTPAIDYKTRSVSWVDYDNDGDRDLFVVSDIEGSRLFRQDPELLFVDVTVSSGLFTDAIDTYSVSWGDINNDGCLDLFYSNRTLNSLITNYLFQSNCDGTFTNITSTAGLSQDPRLTFGASFFDYNNDGFQDIYVINDKNGSNFLYENDGDSTFTDVSSQTSTGIVVDAMSVTIDDYNSDGFFDIYITNTPSDVATPTLGSVLLKNVNGQYFEDVSSSSGTLLDGWCWGSNFFDADNDMDLDLYVSCIYTLPGERQSYGFYQNDTLEVFSEPTNIGFANNDIDSHGSVIGDADNDGKVDIAVVNNGGLVPNLWMNKTVTTNNYLTISLEGTTSNKDGIGSKIEISINGVKQYRYVINGEGYLSQNSFKEFFGLGENTVVDYVKVYWLSGTIDTILNVTANQILNIVEGSNVLSNPNLEISEDFLIHPNPTSDRLSFKSRNIIETITMYNVLGQEVFKSYYDSLEVDIDISNLSSGAYFVKTSLSGVIKTSRIIKQ
ncbi:hypothetical protein BTO05_00220 [Winogradskyella sp. PC-19]|uniref:FG-GAP-like repeat-containing protein n=1 Tax=unclassified Winogradskyella TaxID=2615021 RepID=UPI000B3D1192|nr:MULTISPECIES: FG-GAP-like repeat-containing protein [unclassified Winogradskyella]ARV08139.1 hypothetical protein BTO05_00220 [Winogradskyella sp. PC-19]